MGDASFEELVEKIHHDVFTSRPHFNRPWQAKKWATKKGFSMVGGAAAGAAVGTIAFPGLGSLGGAIAGFLAGMVAGQVAGDVAGEIPAGGRSILGRLRKKTPLVMTSSDVEHLKSDLTGKINRSLNKLRGSQSKYTANVKTLQKELGSPTASEQSVSKRLQETVRALFECEYYTEKSRMLLLNVSEAAHRTTSDLDPIRSRIETDLEALSSWFHAYQSSTRGSSSGAGLPRSRRTPPPLPPKPARPRP